MPWKQEDLFLHLFLQCDTDFLRFAVDRCWGNKKHNSLPKPCEWDSLCTHHLVFPSSFPENQMTCLLLTLRLFDSSVLCNFQAPGVNWKEQILCCIQTWLNVADRGTVWKSVPDPGPDPVIASSLFQAPDREGLIHNLSADFYLATFWRHLFIPRALLGWEVVFWKAFSEYLKSLA